MRCVALLFFAAAAPAAARGSAAHAHENDLSRFSPAALTVALQAGASVALSQAAAADGDTITVSVVNPAFAHGDFIAQYLADADPTTTVPLKWTYLEPYVPSYSVNGTGDVRFQVFNSRAPAVFYLAKGSTARPTIIATSPRLTFDYSAPVRPRVLPGPAPGSYAIAWTTDAAAAPTAALAWRVGGAPGAPMTHTTPATAAYVARSDLCGAPANTVGFMDLGAQVTAQLPQLAQAAAGQTVFYAVTDAAHTSQEFSFAVPPLPGQGAYPFTFAAFGDMGRGSFDDGITWKEYGAASKNTSKWLAQEKDVAFIQHFGVSGRGARAPRLALPHC